MDKTINKRKVVWIILPIIIVMGIYFGRDFYLKQKYPCRHRSYASLMKEYKELVAIWNKKIAFLDAQEAEEKILSAKLELAIKKGTITEKQAMEMELKMFDRSLEGEARFDAEFQATCRHLTGTQ